MSGLTLNTVGSLVGLVSDIAARGEKSTRSQSPRSLGNQAQNQRKREPEDG